LWNACDRALNEPVMARTSVHPWSFIVRKNWPYNPPARPDQEGADLAGFVFDDPTCLGEELKEQSRHQEPEHRAVRSFPPAADRLDDHKMVGLDGVPDVVSGRQGDHGLLDWVLFIDHSNCRRTTGPRKEKRPSRRLDRFEKCGL